MHHSVRTKALPGAMPDFADSSRRALINPERYSEAFELAATVRRQLWIAVREFRSTYRG